MSGRLKYDFEAIDTHHSTVARIVSSMQDNYQHITSLKQQLIDAGFTGAGAEAFDQKMRELDGRLTSYGQALSSLGRAVQEVGGKGGIMQITDTNNGKGFLAI